MRDSRPAAPSLSNRGYEGSRDSRRPGALRQVSLRVATHLCVGEPSVKGCNPSGAPAILCSACTGGEMGKRTTKEWRKGPAIKRMGGGGGKRGKKIPLNTLD